jgi:hypothetical protein
MLGLALPETEGTVDTQLGMVVVAYDDVRNQVQATGRSELKRSSHKASTSLGTYVASATAVRSLASRQ